MHIVQVRLRKPRRVFPFLCDSNLGLVRDEPCIVQTDRGTEWGTCLMPPEPIPYEMERRYSMRVLRKANMGDHDTQHYLVTEEQKARKVAFDAATLGSVITRLEARGWVRREAHAEDRRRKCLWVTPAGAAAAQSMRRSVGKVQQRILSPLEPAEREQLIALLDRLVAGHADLAGAG